MIRLFARHPTAGNLLMVAFSALGIFTLVALQRESMPEVAPSEVEVRVIYPGAGAEEVEEAVCRPLEEALDGISYVEEVRSEALEGLGKVTLKMVEAGDFDAFQGDVDDKISGLDTLPEGAEEPVIKALGTEDRVLAILVSGPATVQELKAYCEDLKDRLRRLPQVSLVEVQGFGDHQLRVELSQEALARYDLGPADVSDAISAQSVDIPAGILETSERDLLARFVERRRTPEQLEDLVIYAEAGGAEIRLGELGRVVDLFDDPFDQVVLGGRRAGRLEVKKTRAEDSLEIADSVRAFVEQERMQMPESVQLVITEDASTNLRGQIGLVVTNGWQGMILVALSLFLFFTLRLAWWVVMGLPVSVLGACIFMPQIGLTVNTLTLVGFLLALGLLMDDAIVIAENIATHKQRGKSGVQAAIDGVNEVKVGVISSFLTTICVLGPLATIGGDIGQRLRVVPMILILVMAVSLIEAFLILPGHLGHALEHQNPGPPGVFRRRIETLMDFIRERLVGRTLDKLLERRYLFVGGAFGLLVACLGLFVGGRIPFQALPDMQGDVIVARILMSQGTPLDRTQKVVAEVLRGLEETNAEWSARQNGGAPLVVESNVRYGRNVDAFESGAHVATVSVDLLTAEKRTGRIDDYLRSWREHAGRQADALEIIFTTPGVGAAGRPIEVRISSDDLEELATCSREVEEWLGRFDGVQNLLSDLRPGKPEVRLTVIEGTRGLGLDASTIARQVNAAFQGATADELQVGPETYKIDVRLASEGRDTLSDLERFQLPLPGGGHAPLPAVVNLEPGRGWARIARIDGVRTVTVRGDVDTTRGNTAAILEVFQSDFLPGFQEAHPDVTLDLAGEAKESAETRGSMVTKMLVGLMGVFLLLSFQFRSYIEPLIVMVAIPLALIGVILGHLLLGFPFTLPSILGFVALAGVVVNDSILLVEFIKIKLRAGLPAIQAAAQASRARFRAVLLTSSTTIAGLLPLLAEGSLQAQLLKGLVISVTFGLMASTVLVLFVVPCLYAILDDLGLTAETQETPASAATQ